MFWYNLPMKVFVKREAKGVLKICPQGDGSVLVVAPRFLPQREIAKYIAENLPWISQRIGKSNSVTISSTRQGDQPQQSAVIDNQTVKDIFLGKCMLLCGQLYACKPSVNNQTSLKEDCLFVSEKQFFSRQLRIKAIQTFLKRMAASVLSQEISKVGSVVALCPTKIQFRDLHGLWCSCRDAEVRAIVLDYRVIQLPQHLQNYVIAHVFAHFVRQGHSAEFFETLANYLPNYKQLQKEIECYNFLLDV